MPNRVINRLLHIFEDFTALVNSPDFSKSIAWALNDNDVVGRDGLWVDLARMNRRSTLFVGFCLAMLYLTGTARAGDQVIILGENRSFWTNNAESPISRAMYQLKSQFNVTSVAFAPTGDYVVLVGANKYFASNLGLPACQKLSELQPANSDFKCVAFAPDGECGWSVLWNQHGNWSSEGIPDAAFKKMQEVVKGGGTLRSIAYGKNGEWVILFDKAGVVYGNVPDDLAKVLDNAAATGLAIQCVCFTTTGVWICLTNNGWWTNDLNHPASRMIAELVRQHKPLHWVAVTPEMGPHDFKKWAEVVRRQCDGKLAGGYAYEVLEKGKVVLQEADGWARAPWETEDPSVKWTAKQPMAIASISKTITAVALLRLWEELGKRFSLDEPFWPHIKLVCPQASDGVRKVTIRQLLQHRSGFKKMEDLTSPEAIEQLLTQPLAHPPGEHEEYDNNNFYIARLVLEQIGHTKYTTYVKAHVLVPMGITRMETRFDEHDTTCGYGEVGSTRPGFPFDWNCDDTAGAAGWFASVDDLGKFLIGLREQKVLTPQVTAMMFKDLLGWNKSYPGIEKRGDWTWDEGSQPGSRFGAVHSSLYHFPDDVDAVMLINCQSPSPAEEILANAWIESMQK